MKQRNLLPMKLQFFAEPGQEPTPPPQQNQQLQNQQPAAPAANIDYERIASLVAGRQTVTEDAVLKNYFKQQGLSQEEMTAAIATFKEQKAAQTPDVDAMQQQLTQAQQIAAQAQIEQQATLEALKLGVDIKTVPYVLKMADLSNVTGDDGSINAETLKNALTKVLEDVPQLKPSKENPNGFTQIGAGSGQQQNQTNEDALKAVFGLN